MHETDGKGVERSGQHLVVCFRGLVIEDIRFVDQRANPVGLLTILTHVAQSFDDLAPSRFGQGNGRYRVPTGRQLVDCCLDSKPDRVITDIKTGAVDAYDPDQDRFVSIEERYGLGG